MKKLLMVMVLGVCATVGFAQGLRSKRTQRIRSLCPLASESSNRQVCVSVTNGIEWTYKVIDGGVVLWGGEWRLVKNDKIVVRAIPVNTSGDLVIPDRIADLPVRGIQAEAFLGCSNLTSVTIPPSVTRIGQRAFGGCSGLSSVTIPSSVTSIGRLAFYNCSGLRSVTIPSSVTSIEQGAFEGCSGLASVTIPEGVTSIGHSAFYNCSGLRSVTIPSSVTSIKSIAFSGCRGLSSIVVSPKNQRYSSVDGLLCTKDGKTVIAGVNGDVTIPLGVTCIGRDAFFRCVGLMSVTLPPSVVSIGDRAFLGCGNLTSVTIPGSVTSIGYRAFFGCSNLTSVTIPSCVTSIGPDAFSETPFYEKAPDGLVVFGRVLVACKGECPPVVTISSNVTSIGVAAFSDCSNLTSVTIPPSVTSVGSSAFSGCSGLTSVMLQGGVRTIGYKVFSGCTGLMSVLIPSCVTSIGDGAFWGCSNLTSVTIPSGVTNIDVRAFSGCDKLMSFSVSPENPKFSSANGLLCTKDGKILIARTNGDVIIPLGVTSIGYGKFSGCSELTSVTIPSSVTNIDALAFSKCGKLMSFSVSPENQKYSSVNGLLCTKDGKTVIAGVNGDVLIPSNVTNIASRAFAGCGGLTSVAMQEGMKEIGYGAFFECTNLTSVTIPSSVSHTGRALFCKHSRLTSMTTPARGFKYLFERSSIPISLARIEISDGETAVGKEAFLGCRGLTSVTIPPSVTSIGERAFSGCAELASVTIPANVTNVGNAVFADCARLLEIRLEAGNSRYKAVDGVLYTKDMKCLVAGPGGKESLVIPVGVSEISRDAFRCCRKLKSVVISPGMSRIGDYAFCGTALESLSIPLGVTSIGCGAFSVCSGLDSATIPSSLTNAVRSVFGREGKLLQPMNGMTTVIFEKSGARF